MKLLFNNDTVWDESKVEIICDIMQLFLDLTWKLTIILFRLVINILHIGSFINKWSSNLKIDTDSYLKNIHSVAVEG